MTDLTTKEAGPLVHVGPTELPDLVGRPLGGVLASDLHGFQPGADQVYVEFVLNPQNRENSPPELDQVALVGARATALAIPRHVVTDEPTDEPLVERAMTEWPDGRTPLNTWVPVMAERMWFGYGHDSTDENGPQVISEFVSEAELEGQVGFATTQIKPELFPLAKGAGMIAGGFDVRVLSESVDPSGQPGLITIVARKENRRPEFFGPMFEACVFEYKAFRAQGYNINEATALALNDIGMKAALVAAEDDTEILVTTREHRLPALGPAEDSGQRALPAAE